MNARTPATLALSALLLAMLASCSSSDDDGSSVTVPDGGGTGSGTGTGTGTDTGTDTGGNGSDSGVVTGVIDRMGRPGVSTALIRTDDDEDAYNANGDPGTWAAAFTAPIVERVRLIDSLDGTIGNALLDADTLTGLLVDDRLQIDTSVPECDAYLAIEIGLGGCGGRTLERDVIDDTLRHLVSQDTPVSDLADGNENALPTGWPFLADPN